MKYGHLFVSVKKQLKNLKTKYSFDISPNSWVNEALEYTEELINAISSNIGEEEYFSREELLYDKTVTSLHELIELNNILLLIDSLDDENKKILVKKLKIFLNSAPLLLKDEDTNLNEGRNLIFEVRLFRRLKDKGYKPVLSLTHPDIQLIENGHEYAIECKRVFKIETLVPNIKDAINQLMKFSLDSNTRYGIVAVSITRCLPTIDKRFEAKFESAAKARLHLEMENLFNSYKNQFISLFCIRIPALIFEFNDRAVIGKPYSISLMDVYETANGNFSIFNTVRKDFAKLI